MFDSRLQRGERRRRGKVERPFQLDGVGDGKAQDGAQHADGFGQLHASHAHGRRATRGIDAGEVHVDRGDVAGRESPVHGGEQIAADGVGLGGDAQPLQRGDAAHEGRGGVERAVAGRALDVGALAIDLGLRHVDAGAALAAGLEALPDADVDVGDAAAAGRARPCGDLQLGVAADAQRGVDERSFCFGHTGTRDHDAARVALRTGHHLIQRENGLGGEDRGIGEQPQHPERHYRAQHAHTPDTRVRAALDASSEHDGGGRYDDCRVRRFWERAGWWAGAPW